MWISPFDAAESTVSSNSAVDGFGGAPSGFATSGNRQLISIHVRLQFFDSSLRGFFAKDRVPLFEQPLRQLRDVFGVINQVANLNSAHTNSVFDLTRIS